MEQDIKLGLGYEIINSYKRLSYKQWFALAEYVDNSTQALLNNPDLIELFRVNEDILTVDISFNPENGGTIKILDNSIGMTYEELKNAIIIGNPPAVASGRSRYGLGMKTASFWLGNDWEVTTKKLGETVEHKIGINLMEAVSKSGELKYSRIDNLPKESHYTNIIITNLNQPFSNRTKGKIKDYLRSMYRYDIHNKTLKLLWQGEELKWNYNEVLGKLKKFSDGNDKVTLDFMVGSKRVTGWGGVLEDGSRAKAGFSLFHNERVIMGWPNSYKPESIFGPEGGRNDLINQRVVGELFMNDFTVSHTKDEIIFENDEEDVLEFSLKEKLVNAISLARQTQKGQILSTLMVDEVAGEYEKALGFLEVEFNSPELSDAFTNFEIPDEEIIEENNKLLLQNAANGSEPTFTVNLGSLTVRVFLESNISMNDPYLSLGIHSEENKLDVLINKSHPHWRELISSETIMNYIRHCVYDGVAEWKATKFLGAVHPDTVKTIKDNLLRTAYNIRMDYD